MRWQTLEPTSTPSTSRPLVSVVCSVVSFPGLIPRPHSQISFLSLIPRPRSQALFQGLIPRPHSQASFPGLIPRPHSQASFPGYILRPCSKVSFPGLFPGLIPGPCSQASFPGHVPRPIYISYWMGSRPISLDIGRVCAVFGRVRRTSQIQARCLVILDNYPSNEKFIV